MKCIFCDNENFANSIEHIVPESLGNKKYVLKKGSVCDECNNKFSKFEEKALTKSVLLMERARLGIKTKKEKNVKGKIDNLSIEGDENFRKQIVNLQGLSNENFSTIEGKEKKYQLYIPGFDKSAAAMSKILLKIGFESIFKSQKSILKKYNFSELKDYLTSKTNNDWPFTDTDINLDNFSSIPSHNTKYKLKLIRCILEYKEYNENTLLFRFKYGGIPMTINLINRNLNWLGNEITPAKYNRIYPEHFRKKTVNP